MANPCKRWPSWVRITWACGPQSWRRWGSASNSARCCSPTKKWRVCNTRRPARARWSPFIGAQNALSWHGDSLGWQRRGHIRIPLGRRDRALAPDAVKKQLVDFGQWTALRARPFGKVADPATAARSIFVNAMDTNPLAPDMARVLRGERTVLHWAWKSSQNS